MRPRYITAFEHEVVPVESGIPQVGVTAEEAEYLAKLGERRPGFFERGYRSIRLAQYCGVVSLGERILEILPKLDEASPAETCRGMLLQMLRRTDRFPHFRHLSVGQHLRRAPLLEVFIAAFFDALTVIVRGGLMRRYQEHEADLLCVRGRILTNRQFAVLANRTDIVACAFDDLTADNVWNQSIKAGLRAVRPWITTTELHRRWVELMAVMDEVSDLPVDARTLNRLVFDRHAARYRIVIDWVRWILSLLSPALRAGENEAPALLFDMNRLFESMVASILRQRAGQDVEVIAQHTGRYLASIQGPGAYREFGLRPDLVLERGRIVIAIGDTKWKKLEIGNAGYMLPAQSDVYQMLAYSSAFKCDHLALIYPWHSGLSGAKETIFDIPSSDMTTSTLVVICLDVASDNLDLVIGSSSHGLGPLLATRK